MNYIYLLYGFFICYDEVFRSVLMLKCISLGLESVLVVGFCVGIRDYENGCLLS